jgi:hypothetical protein
MAIFNPAGIPAGVAFDNAVLAVRQILRANIYISDEVDRQVAAAAPHDTTAWETARGAAIRQALVNNALFKQAVRTDPVAGPFLDPAI